MAEVFLAKTFGAEGFERFLAVKRLLPGVMHNDEFVKMFIDEAKIAAQLAHANIVQIYELNEWEKQLYIAMEFVHGKELRALAVRSKKLGRRLDQRFCAHIVAKSAEGLDYAHHKKDPLGKPLGLIHRDISPQNILLSYDGEAKVIDFGIAKAKDRMSQTQVGVLKGKIGYMSPEQVTGTEIDARSDLFSLGCVLYELLTQERTFKGETEFATFEKVRNADYTDPKAYGVDLEPGLDKILKKALAKDREQRYQRGSELASDLQRWLLMTGEPLSNDDVADGIRGLFPNEYKAEMEKLGQYRQTKPPKDTSELLENKQRRVAAEKELEEHTVMISLAPKDEVEDGYTVTDRMQIGTDMIVHDDKPNKTPVSPKTPPPKAPPSEERSRAAMDPSRASSGKPQARLTESQEIENEIREAFSGAQAQQVLAEAKRKTDPAMRMQQRKQVPRQMVETIDDVNTDVSGFTRGEIILIVSASLFALLFVLAVYFYTTRGGP